jgi:hypothetical protein
LIDKRVGGDKEFSVPPPQDVPTESNSRFLQTRDALGNVFYVKGNVCLVLGYGYR